MTKISYSGYRFPPEIIQHAIWLYIRFTLSFRDVEDLLAERGIMVSYETVRRWVNHFGPMVAADLRKRRPKPHTTWHLDEVYLKIDGRMVYLWRAVDAEGEVLDVLVQTRRNKRAALKLMRKLLKKYGFVPDKLVTDELRSYAAFNLSIPGSFLISSVSVAVLSLSQHLRHFRMFDCVLQNKERRGSCAILVAARAGVQVNVGNAVFHETTNVIEPSFSCHVGKIAGGFWSFSCRRRASRREYVIDLPQLHAFVQATHEPLVAAFNLDEDGPVRQKFLARLQGKSPSAASLTFCAAASSMVRTISTSSMARLRRVIQRPPRVSLRTGSASPASSNTAATRHKLALELGLFINGLPIATFELKNSLTKQTVEDAVQQYKRDRTLGNCCSSSGAVWCTLPWTTPRCASALI